MRCRPDQEGKRMQEDLHQPMIVAQVGRYCTVVMVSSLV